MKTKIIIAIVLLSQISCKSQTKDTLINNNIKKDNMRYFDKEKYKKLQKNPKYSDERCYLDTNGDEIRITGSLTEIYEDINKVNSPITNYYVYHLNFVQKAIGQKFYGFPIGIAKEFNTSGELIKETNHDLPFNFSIDQLCELISKEYNIDLMKKTDYNKDSISHNCSRYKKKEVYKDDFRPVYEVMFRVNSDGKEIPRKVVTIDGKTGKILYEKLYYSEYPGINKLPKSKSQVKVIDSEKKNSVPIGTFDNNNNDNNDSNDNNSKPLFIIALLLALLVITAIVYFKYKEEAAYNRIHLVR